MSNVILNCYWLNYMTIFPETLLCIIDTAKSSQEILYVQIL